ncbi:MAG: hypothetical protein KDB00_09715 [Planctomycetales bacterium]|nr:hypothetical protein [Planctomycetales bacterium]
MNRPPVAAAIVVLIVIGSVVASGPRESGDAPTTQRQSVSPPLVTQLAQVSVAEPAAQPTFVGRQACLECHPDNYRMHGHHGHATTFRSASDPDVADKFVGKSFDAGEPFGTYTYHSDDQGIFARLREKFGDQPFRFQFALGHKSITLLSLLPDPVEGTVGLEHRVSWIDGPDHLGKTPGQRDETLINAAQLFGNPHHGKVMHKCVYCHVTTGEIVGQEIKNLTPNVNCEKCHGPASEHVRLAKASKTPPPFSVGRSDWDTESEIQLCGDCHRLPKDVSQKQLRDYPDLLTRFQPVGLLRSECFVQSEGKLKCTTCHNPHQSVSETTAAIQVQNCVACHQQDSQSHVACPVSPTDGCIDCHMPAFQLDGLGTSFHDHWIRVRDDQ